jgi:hypothetical protein
MVRWFQGVHCRHPPADGERCFQRCFGFLPEGFGKVGWLSWLDGHHRVLSTFTSIGCRAVLTYW